MRILVLSNFYPPHYIGGYELGCAEAVAGLTARGHQVKVLTSTYGINQMVDDGQVYRRLRTYIGRGFNEIELLGKELHNRRVFTQMVNYFKPEVVYVWNLWQVSLGLVYIARRVGLPISYYVFDNWITTWGQTDDWLSWWHRPQSRWLKPGWRGKLGRLVTLAGLNTQIAPLDLNQAQFASHFLKSQAQQAGQPVAQARVIHWGLNLAQFPYRSQIAQPVHRLLYVGQLVPHKGVHTVIEALRLLREQYGHQDIELTVVGGTILPDYERQLKEQAQQWGLTGRVYFTGSLPRVTLSQIYQKHDIMIVPSIWDEPFGLILLEAMASGLAVVGTATGGSAEILQDMVNGLIFAKEDAAACAACLHRLLADPVLYEQLRRQGRQTVEQKFRLEQTMAQIEQSLQETILATL